MNNWYFTDKNGKSLYDSNIGIQWILHQAYDTGNYIYNNTPSYIDRKTVKTVGRIVYGITHNLASYSECKFIDGNSLTGEIQRISWVNLIDTPVKKSENEDKWSNMSIVTFHDVESCYEKINSANAKILILTGCTMSYLWKNWEKYRNSHLRKIRFYNADINYENSHEFSCYVEDPDNTGIKKLIIQVYHPSIATDSLCQSIISAVNEYYTDRYELLSYDNKDGDWSLYTFQGINI